MGAPGGPSTWRTNVVPRPGSSTAPRAAAGARRARLTIAADHGQSRLPRPARSPARSGQRTRCCAPWTPCVDACSRAEGGGRGSAALVPAGARARRQGGPPGGVRRRHARHPLHDLLGHQAVRGVGRLAADRRGPARPRPARWPTLLPAFGTNGKDAITLEHVLLHTAGFPHAPLGPPRWDTHEGRAEAFAEWRLNWDVGTRFEYHPTSAHWVLAELIHAVTGTRPHRRRAHPRGRAARAQRLRARACRRTTGDDMPTSCCAASPPPRRAGGRPRHPRDPRRRGHRGGAASASTSPSDRAVGSPAAGGVATAADVTRFYQALLHNTGGLWDPDGAHRRHLGGPQHLPRPDDGRARQPQPRPHPRRRRRPVELPGHGPHGVAPARSGTTGPGVRCAWADPATGLSFCYLTNGLDRNFLREHRRGTRAGQLRRGLRGLDFRERLAAREYLCGPCPAGSRSSSPAPVTMAAGRGAPPGPASPRACCRAGSSARAPRWATS